MAVFKPGMGNGFGPSMKGGPRGFGPARGDGDDGPGRGRGRGRGRGGPPGFMMFGGGGPPGLAKKGGVPPGLAMFGGRPPGLMRGDDDDYDDDDERIVVQPVQQQPPPPPEPLLGNLTQAQQQALLNGVALQQPGAIPLGAQAQPQPLPGTSIGSQLLAQRFQAAPGTQILGPNVLSAARAGNTVGVINSLAGNINTSLLGATNQFLTLTA